MQKKNKTKKESKQIRHIHVAAARDTFMGFWSFPHRLIHEEHADLPRPHGTAE
jgi:hypothetical protein